MRKIKLNVKVVAAFILGAALAGSIATAATTQSNGSIKACADNRTQALFLSNTGSCASLSLSPPQAVEEQVQVLYIRAMRHRASSLPITML